MLSNERRKIITEYVKSAKTCSVNEIIEQFPEVTPATIRRDLTALEEAGIITRSYGSVQAVNTPTVPGFLTRNTFFTEEKQAIARAAANMVKPGDSVLLDTGTTVQAVAMEIQKKSPDIMFVTNSVAIISALEKPKQTVLLTGGIFEYDNLALYGPEAEMFLDRISASILFFSATGIRGTDGLTVISPYHASIKRKMMQCAKKRVLVIDNSKLENVGTILFATFEDVDTLIIPHPIEDPVFTQHLERLGVEVIIAMNS